MNLTSVAILTLDQIFQKRIFHKTAIFPFLELSIFRERHPYRSARLAWTPNTSPPARPLHRRVYALAKSSVTLMRWSS